MRAVAVAAVSIAWLEFMGYIQKSRSRARAVALGGMFSALAVVMMSIGSIIPSLDMSSAFIAGIVIMVVRMEINRTAPITVYLVSGILSLIILPNRFAGICFMCYYGLYPIVKEYIERLRLKPVKWLLKFVTFLLMYTVMIKLGEYFTVATDDIIEIAEPVLYIIGMITSIVYDFFLTIVATRYDILKKRFQSKNK